MIKRFGSSLAILITLLVCIPFVFSYTQKKLEEEKIRKVKTEIDSIVSKMTDKELVGQAIHIAIPSTSLTPDTKSLLQKFLPGGVILFGKNLGSATEISQLTADLQKFNQEQNKIPLMISVDQEGGRVIRVTDGVTQFPGAMAIGQTDNPENSYAVGFITSYELRKLGINVVFAPDLDVNNNPNNPVINTRSFGSDLETVNKMGIAYERGAMAGGSLPVIKHFPGHGDTDVDSHKGLPKIEKTWEELEKLELVPFEKAIQSGAPALMSAHIVFPKIDPDFPATLSRKILTEMLRERLHFEGLIFTDAMEMDAIDRHYQKLEPAKLAILAGADILLMTSWGKAVEETYQTVLKAYQRGEFVREGKDLLKERVKNQLWQKHEMGLFYEEYSPLPFGYEKDYQTERKERQLEYQRLSTTAWNQKISLESIRSYPREYTAPEASSHSFFLLESKELVQLAKEKELTLIGKEELPKKLKEDPEIYVFWETSGPKTLKAVTYYAKRYPKVHWIALHSGSPFLDLPIMENETTLFSFSPTKESLDALLFSATDPKRKTPILDLKLDPGIESQKEDLSGNQK